LSLTAINYRTIEEEHKQIKTEFIWEGEDANKWYFCLRASDDFKIENGRDPNPEDVEALNTKVQALLDQYGIDKSQFDVEMKYVEEM